MPRPPRFVVLDKDGKASTEGRGGDEDKSGRGSQGAVSSRAGGLTFPVICKPMEACGKWFDVSLS